MDLSPSVTQHAPTPAPTNASHSLPRDWHSLGHAFLQRAREQRHCVAVIDSTGITLTYEQLLVVSIKLAMRLRSKLESATCIGILLPPSAGAVVSNIAVTFLDKVSVNLNYASGEALLLNHIAQCGVNKVITSSKFFKRLGLALPCDIIDIDEFGRHSDLLASTKAWLEARFSPEFLLRSYLPGLCIANGYHNGKHTYVSHILGTVSHEKLDEPATVVFTAGSTSEPKGVILSHRNILSNIRAVQMMGCIPPRETVLSVIPFFHSFGFSMTLWAGLCLGETMVYHYDPRDGRRIADLCGEHRATTLICTPTMLSAYLRRTNPEKFSSLKYCIVGGEKLSPMLVAETREKIGLVPLEGYGLAETSSAVTWNVPYDIELPDGRVTFGTKIGTVGLPLPAMQIRIVDDHNSELPAQHSGDVLIKGPQVMRGYLAKPIATKNAIDDNGWFHTGDIGFIDADGFVTITGRTAQFSKIAGEMVPHLAVQESIMRTTGAPQDSLAITAVNDEKRGERLVVVYSSPLIEPHECVRSLLKTQLPPLWVPAANDFVFIDELPVMANGKADLCAVKKIAEQKLGATSPGH